MNQPSSGQNELLEITGSVTDIIYQNQANGYTVIEIETDEELLTAVGQLPDVTKGEELRLYGYFTNHVSYGTQFKVETYDRLLPASVGAIRKYLSAGAVKGIGPVLAGRIVDEFGRDSLEIIENEPERLTAVRGITAKKAKDIAEDFRRICGLRRLMNELGSCGILPADTVRVWNRYGGESVEMIAHNPFVLCEEGLELPFPAVDTLAKMKGFESDCYERIKGGLRYVLIRNLSSGHTCLPAEKLIPTAQKLLGIESASPVADSLEDEITEGNLIRMERGEREFIYLPGMFASEVYAAGRVAMMAKLQSKERNSFEKEIAEIEEELGIEYSETQKKAIALAGTAGIMVLTGGPGTGKTTTLNGMLKLLSKQKKRVLLAAPTGRAAKRMSEVTGREAKTIHRLLKAGAAGDEGLSFAQNEKNPLHADVVMIDEMSMVDIRLFECLLRAIRIGCSLILVGDNDQLPPVGPGNVLRSIIESGAVDVVRLKEVFRQAQDSLIVTNAHRIVGGEYPIIDRRDKDFFFLPSYNYEKTLETVTELYQTRLPRRYGFSPLRDIQVLAPSRIGELGTTRLNQFLQEAVNPLKEGDPEVKSFGMSFRVGDKVMQIRNNYDMILRTPGGDAAGDSDGEAASGVYNGDIGIIESADPRTGVVKVNFDGRIATYEREMLSELEPAYAVTVHKSQGSEYDAVIIPLMNGHSRLYYRNLLYTAVTRAKKILIIMGHPQTLRQMVDNNRRQIRYTCLKQLILEGMGQEDQP